MLEMRARPQCSDCGCRVSSDAPGCDRCGYLLLCDSCDDLHQRQHQREIEPPYEAPPDEPHYPHAGYTIPEVL